MSISIWSRQMQRDWLRDQEDLMGTISLASERPVTVQMIRQLSKLTSPATICVSSELNHFHAFWTLCLSFPLFSQYNFIEECIWRQNGLDNNLPLLWKVLNLWWDLKWILIWQYFYWLSIVTWKPALSFYRLEIKYFLQLSCVYRYLFFEKTNRTKCL